MTGEAPPTGYRRARARMAEIMFTARKDDPLARAVDVMLIVLISFNVLAVIVESVQSIESAYRAFFLAFEIFSVAVFTVEYLLRLWTIVDNPWRPEPHHTIRARIGYVFSWMAIIDLIAILPFYLGFLIGADLRILRALRLLRIFKLTRYSSAMTMLFQVFREERRTIGAAMFVSMLLMMMAATLAYIFEHQVQPDVFSSIPASMYWAMITMTTVGYGDMVPITAVGKLLGALIGVLGLGMVALPAGILASGFNNALHRRRVMLEERIHDAMDDGFISDEEQAELDALVERLNLNPVDARAMMFAIQHQRSKLTKGVCPHCGKGLSDPVVDDETET